MLQRKLSVIIPVYHQRSSIKDNLIRIRDKIRASFPNNEIIVVVDGNDDNIIEEVRKVTGIVVHGYKLNRGKGYALKYGFGKSTGDLVTFMDSDGDIDASELRRFYPYLSAADIVIGNKRHPFSHLEYPFIRRILSRAYSLFVRIFFGLRIHDTQTGLKIFKRDVLEVIMPYILVKRYAFDLELCFLAHKHGFRIVEAPVTIHKQNSMSSVDSNAVWNMFVDTCAVWYRYYILRWYQRQRRDLT